MSPIGHIGKAYSITITSQLFDFWRNSLYIPSAVKMPAETALCVLDGNSLRKMRRYIDSMVIDSTVDFSTATEALKKRSGRDADAHPFSQMPSATWLQRVLTTFSFPVAMAWKKPLGSDDATIGVRMLDELYLSNKCSVTFSRKETPLKCSSNRMS